jgi:hypothetical protein
MGGVAWGVWHDQELFDEMKEVLECPLDHVDPDATSSQGERVAWFRWLAAMNAKHTAYNVHALWIWYFTTKIRGGV